MRTKRSVVLYICIGLALLAVCISGCRQTSPENDKPTTDPTLEPTPSPVDPVRQEEDPNTVVFYVGEEPVCNYEYRYHMVAAINAYANTAEAWEVGFDPTIPLRDQLYPDSELTFEDIFTENVMDDLKYSVAMYLESKAAGFTLSQENAQTIDTFFRELDEYIVQEDITAEKALEDRYGMAMTTEQVRFVMERSMLGWSYSRHFIDGLEYSDKEIEEFFEGVKHEVFIPDVNAVSLRLIHFHNMQIALDVQEKFEQGDMTEESFIELVKLYSMNDSEIQRGGLVTDVKPENYVESQFDEVEKWVFDLARKPGDHSVITTADGYILVYFVEQVEPLWKSWSRQTKTNMEISGILDKYEISYP